MKRLLGGVLVLAWCLLSGCAEPSYWYQRTFWGIECRPDRLVNGYCTPVKKGSPDAQAARP
jgi:hypothetical protein